jgi:hypothetical protein
LVVVLMMPPRRVITKCWHLAVITAHVLAEMDPATIAASMILGLGHALATKLFTVSPPPPAPIVFSAHSTLASVI